MEKPPGGTLVRGLAGVLMGVATGSSETTTPGIPISSPVNGFTEMKSKIYFVSNVQFLATSKLI